MAAYKYATQEFIKRGVDFAAIFADKQRDGADLNNLAYGLPETVEFIKEQSEEFTRQDQFLMDLDKAVARLVGQYEKVAEVVKDKEAKNLQPKAAYSAGVGKKIKEITTPRQVESVEEIKEPVVPPVTLEEEPLEEPVESGLSKYETWLGEIYNEVGELMDASRGDAQGIVEAQSFIVSQEWGKGTNAKDAAKVIVAKAKEQAASFEPAVVESAEEKRKREDKEWRAQHAINMTKDMNFIKDYKGWKIYEKEDSKTQELTHIVVDPDDSVLIVGMDDSKSSGRRTFVSTTVADCERFIDWHVTAQEEREKRKQAAAGAVVEVEPVVEPAVEETSLTAEAPTLTKEDFIEQIEAFQSLLDLDPEDVEVKEQLDAFLSLYEMEYGEPYQKMEKGGAVSPKFKKGDIVVSVNGSVFKITEFQQTKTDTWYEGDYYTFFGEAKIGGKIKTINERDIMGYYDLKNSKIDYVEPYQKMENGGEVRMTSAQLYSEDGQKLTQLEQEHRDLLNRTGYYSKGVGKLARRIQVLKEKMGLFPKEKMEKGGSVALDPIEFELGEEYEFMGAIANELRKHGIDAKARFFDQYQGAYITTAGKKFWVKEIYSTGKRVYAGGKEPKYKSALLLDANGAETSANRGDYFSLPKDHVFSKHKLVLYDMNGQKTTIKNPKVSDLPDLLEIGSTFTYEKGSDTEHIILMDEKDPEWPIEVTEHNGKYDVSELLPYLIDDRFNGVPAKKLEEGGAVDKFAQEFYDDNDGDINNAIQAAKDLIRANNSKGRLNEDIANIVEMVESAPFSVTDKIMFFVETGLVRKAQQFKGGGEIAFESSNLYLNGKGRDTNGNPVVKVAFPDQPAFAIHMANGSLPKTYRILKSVEKISELSPEQVNEIEKEVVDYVSKFGSKAQKEKLKVYGQSKGVKANLDKVGFSNVELKKMIAPFLKEYPERGAWAEEGYTEIIIQDGKVIEYIHLPKQTASEIQDIISLRLPKTESEGSYVNIITEDGKQIDNAIISKATADKIQEKIYKEGHVFEKGGSVGNGTEKRLAIEKQLAEKGVKLSKRTDDGFAVKGVYKGEDIEGYNYGEHELPKGICDLLDKYNRLQIELDKFEKGGGVSKVYSLTPYKDQGAAGMIEAVYGKGEKFEGKYDEAVAKAKEMLEKYDWCKEVDISAAGKKFSKKVAKVNKERVIKFEDGGSIDNDEAGIENFSAPQIGVTPTYQVEEGTPQFENGGSVRDAWYEPDYYATMGESGALKASSDFNTAYKDALDLYKREKKAGSLDELQYIGVNTNANDFAIIHIEKRYIDNMHPDAFKDKSMRDAWMAVANKVLETGKPAKGKYVPKLEDGGEVEREKNWVVLVYDEDDNIIERWTIEGRTEHEASREAESEVEQRFPDAADWTLTQTKADGGSVDNDESGIENFSAPQIGAVQTYQVEEGAPQFEKGGSIKLPAHGTPEWHQLQIAKKTIKMSPAMASVMGGMDYTEAERIINKYSANPKYEYGIYTVSEGNQEGELAHTFFSENPDIDDPYGDDVPVSVGSNQVVRRIS